MRSNRPTLKCFAIVLLLLFCQKVGGGLYLHNWLHANACKQISDTNGEVVSGYNCSCIDDFSMPFAESAKPLVQKISPEHIEFTSSYKFLIPFSAPSFHLQRGPPFFHNYYVPNECQQPVEYFVCSVSRVFNTKTKCYDKKFNVYYRKPIHLR